jgi:Coenzyme PQQ synthesis protein D (PqqD)
MDTTLLRKTELVEDPGGPQLERVFVRSQAVVSRRVAGETLIVPVRGKVGDLASIYSFNETGSLIWQTLESPKGLAELINAVQEEYAVERDQAERDVKQFLNDTLSVGLVEVCEQVAIAAMNSTAQGEMQSASSR